MKGILTFIVVAVLMVGSFFLGMKYFEKEHCYVSDKGINIDNVVDDGREGITNLVDSIRYQFE